jgi:hypothetical protein
MAENIKISDLTFDGIRQSLVDYMKSTDTFKSYDFAGSALSTMIDLLTYNTFYYAFYSNMIANEMFLDTAQLENSMISLAKPLGYLVSNSASATATVRMTNMSLNQTVSYFSTFRGYDKNGVAYYFFNLDDVSVNTVINGEAESGETNYFNIYEGKSRTFRQTVNVDITTQSFFLEGKQIDPRTIVVEVSTDGVNFERWVNYYTNPDTVIDSSSKVFFLERKVSGYNVMFGRQSSTDVSSATVGKTVTSTDIIRVSYIVASGEAANTISGFQFVSDSLGNAVSTSTTDVVTLVEAKNGRSTPDLDAIRFFAPKTFSRQNRLVTKNDYYAILNELGYSTGTDPDFDYKVFGGEEATPPYYGRVFVSIMDLNPTDLENYTDINQVNQVMSILKNQSVISILPEYIPPVEIDMKLIVNAILPGASSNAINSAKSAIKDSMMQKFGVNKFNNNFIEDDIRDMVRDQVPQISVSDDGIFIYARATAVSNNDVKRINFKNKIAINVQGNVSIDLPDYIIRDVYSAGKLFKYDKESNALLDSVAVGEVDYDNGVVTLYQSLGVITTPFLVEIRCRDDDFLAKDEFVCKFTSQNNIQINITPS